MYDEVYGLYGEPGKIELYKNIYLKIEENYPHPYVDIKTGEIFNEDRY